MAVDFKDYYKILGVDRKADDKTIKSGYRRLARKHHPDVTKGGKDSAERFKEINEAYEVLSDPEKRRRNGWQRVRRQVDVKIPAGVKSDQRVRVAGEGGGGAAARGDLYLTVTVAPHPFFERKGDDIHLTLPVTAPEAALGAALEVPTLRGKVSMKIPPATSSGRTV